jgi:hypothetical protein
MKKKKIAALAFAGASLGLIATAPGAGAGHGGQYNATSPGNEKCHDTGRPGGDSEEPSSKGLGRAAQNDKSAISPFSCDS